MTEIWKDISKYKGLYRISSTGKVMSLRNNRHRMRELILKQNIGNHGYFWKYKSVAL